MSEVILTPSSLCGAVTLPPSKSAAHRALICAALSDCPCRVQPLSDSVDICATQRALQSLLQADGTHITEIDCAESGSTLRFLIPVAAALGKAVRFVGHGKLPTRPIGDYLCLLPQHGVQCVSTGGLPLEIRGRLTPGTFALAGDVSSQYITGLLLALPLCGADSQIVLTTPLQSASYVDMTLDVLRRFGVHVQKTENGYFVPGEQCYHAPEYTVEADWSQAAFYFAAGAIGGDVTVQGVDLHSVQGDRAVVELTRRFGAEVTADEAAHTVRIRSGALHGISIDAKDIPDMVPALCVMAAFAEGKTVISGVERLRYKESDRIASVVQNLQAMGADVSGGGDAIVIQGGRALHGARLRGFNDHRIVMAFSVAALYARGETVMDDAESIRKSYPDFFEDYNRLGGKAWVQHSDKI